MSNYSSCFRLFLVLVKFCIFFSLLIQFMPRDLTRTKLTTDALMADSKIFMRGKVLRVAVVHYPPSIIITKRPDGTFAYRGAVIDFLDYFALALDISYEYIHITAEDVKKYGQTPAQMNTIINGLADLAPYGLLPSPSKYEVIDMSVPFYMEPYRIVVPWPQPESPLLAPIRPFQPLVWLCLGVTLVVMPIALVYLTGLYRKYIGINAVQPQGNQQDGIMRLKNLEHNVMFMLSHLTNQGYRYGLRLVSRGSFLLVAIWCLMTVVLSNGYASTLFSFLSVTKLQPIINSIEELAYNTDGVKLLVQARTEYANRLLNATYGPEKIIGDTLRENPGNFISNLQEVKAKLATGKYAFVSFPFFHSMLVDSTYRENGKKCRVTIAKELVSLFTPVCMALGKDGPYTTAINEQIQAILEAGLMEYFIKKFMPRIDQCFVENQHVGARQKSLSLVDMSSAFVIFGLGMSLSILVFFLEIVYGKIKCSGKK